MRKALRYTLLVCALLITQNAYASEEEPIDRLAWKQRALLPTSIGKLRTIRELVVWCQYETEMPEPDQTPCLAATELQKAYSPSKDVAMIKTAIAMLKDAPQTPLVKDHIVVLESGLKEIMDNLQPPRHEKQR